MRRAMAGRCKAIAIPTSTCDASVCDTLLGCLIGGGLVQCSCAAASLHDCGCRAPSMFFRGLSAPRQGDEIDSRGVRGRIVEFTFRRWTEGQAVAPIKMVLGGALTE